ncbi:expressed protein [Phakopsora pachyrhizi]|uniref:Expressed protein n=1 Tax=Phakopsora pachyrhizi TaxID=170000 RepID=A0AAV0AJB9_PHAPC|nr:expressed protein [Phakopsora pachyrhizi]
MFSVAYVVGSVKRTTCLFSPSKINFYFSHLYFLFFILHESLFFSANQARQTLFSSPQSITAN